MTVFRYSEDQRQGILNAIPLRDGVDREALIAGLAEAATYSIHSRQWWKAVPNKRKFEDQLKRLDFALKKLDPETRRAVDHFLSEHQASLDDVDEAVGRARAELAVLFPSGRGSKSRNPQAENFLRHCASIWRQYTDRPLPRSVKEGSPFAVFCEAAIPAELKKGDGVTRLINHVIDPNHARTRTRFF